MVDFKLTEDQFANAHKYHEDDMTSSAIARNLGVVTAAVNIALRYKDYEAYLEGHFSGNANPAAKQESEEEEGGVPATQVVPAIAKERIRVTVGYLTAIEGMVYLRQAELRDLDDQLAIKRKQLKQIEAFIVGATE